MPDSIEARVRSLVKVTCEIKTETSTYLSIIIDGRVFLIPHSVIADVVHTRPRADGGYDGHIAVLKQFADREEVPYEQY